MNERLEHFRRSARLHHDIEVCKQLGKKLKIVREIIEQINRTRDLKTR